MIECHLLSGSVETKRATDALHHDPRELAKVITYVRASLIAEELHEFASVGVRIGLLELSCRLLHALQVPVGHEFARIGLIAVRVGEGYAGSIGKKYRFVET